MGKVLILTSKLVDKKKQFVDLIKKNFQSKVSEIVLKEVRSTMLKLDQNQIEVFIDGQNIKEYDLTYLRGISGGSIFITTTLAMCFEKLGVKYFDTIYSRSGPHRSKLGSLVLLASNNLPIPKTIYFADQSYQTHFEEMKNYLGVPFVAKEMSLQRGEGVHLIKTIEDLKELPTTSVGGSNNDYFFQKFIDKDHEYRLLTLGNTVGVWEEKIKKDDTEFRNNVALGAEEVFYDASKTPSPVAEVATEAGKVLGIEIGGVDIMTERVTNKVYLLEVNRGPGLTYDESVSPEFKAIAAFLEKEANV